MKNSKLWIVAISLLIGLHVLAQTPRSNRSSKRSGNDGECPEYAERYGAS